jgi:hypothetical protein
MGDPATEEVYAGATAVNTADIEAQIAAQAHGVDLNAPATSPEQLERQLMAVGRELKALRGTMDAEELAADAVAADEAEDNEARDPAPLVRDSLHQAVMKERIAGLEQKQAALQEALIQAGHPLPTVTQPPVAAVEGARARSGGIPKRRGKQHKTQKSDVAPLEEEDLFEAEAVAATSLVETERDRLIRMVRYTCYDVRAPRICNSGSLCTTQRRVVMCRAC